MHDRIVSWLQALVAIPSVNPAHHSERAQTPGEGALVTYLARVFADLGADEIIYDPVLPKRDNLYAIWHGSDPAVALLDVHLDTVGVEQMTIDPFDPPVTAERVWGRGAVDTKASLAIAIAAIEAHQRTGQPFPLTIMIACTVDEEELASGAIQLARWLTQRRLRPATMVVAEPTNCQPVVGHTGLVRLWLETHGTTAHTAQPHLGVNAIAGMAAVVTASVAEQRRLQALPARALGHGQLTVSRIDGGIGLNIVPDRCRIGIDRRLVDGEDVETVQQQLVALAQAATDLVVTATPIVTAPPYYQSPDHPWIQELCAFHSTTATIAPYGTNAFAYGDIPHCCIVYGPGSIAQAHTADEWISIAELQRAAAWYRHWWRLGTTTTGAH